MSVYFVALGGNAVKIGYSFNPYRRLSQLSSGAAELPKLLTFIDGGRDVEAALHERFADYRIRGEIFRFAGEVHSFVLSLPAQPSTSVEFAEKHPALKTIKLHELLSLARELRAITIGDLEKKTGISNALLSQIETGKVREPSFRNVVKIARALNLSLKRLADTE